MILCSNPKAQYLAHKSEIDQSIKTVLESGRYVLGQEVRSFEEEFASYVGVPYAVGVGSGTEALYIALNACDVEEGDEVITVSHTAVATISAIELCRASPVLVDVEPDYYTIDPQKIESAITHKTKAIIVVHIYGQAVELNPILEIARKRGLKVIEDCAQAHGALYEDQKLGSFGDLACFSFYPTKNLGAIGDGGCIVSKDKELAQKALLLREYGWGEDRISQVPGGNSRLDELQAAILRIKLRHLNEDNQKRRDLADQYDDALKETEIILPHRRMNANHVFHLYVIRTLKRDELMAHLHKHEIHAGIHYAIPVHLHPAYKGRVRISEDLNLTEKIAKEILSLPMYPELNSSDCERIVDSIRSFYAVV